MKNKLDDLLNRANAIGLNKQTGGSAKENESASWGQMKDAFSQRMEQLKEEKNVTKTQVSPYQEVSFPGLPTGKYTAADIFSGRGAPQPFVAPSEEYKLRTGEERLEQLRKAQEDLYTLEGPYGYLANDTVSPEKRAEYQARYDEILNRYGKDATSDSLREQMEQLEGELNANRDRITESKNWTAYSAMTPEEQLAFRRYAEAMSGGAVSFGSDGKIRSPLLEIQGEPEIQAIISKYGKGRVEEIAETLKRDMNRALAEEANALGREVGESLGFGAIPLGVGTGILGTPANLLGLVNEAITGTGQYSTADPYHAGGMLSNLSQGIGAGGAKKAPEQMVNLLEAAGRFNPYVTEGQGAPTNYKPQLYEATRGTKAGEVIDAVGEGAYQVVNTAADSLARAYMGGGIFGAGTTGAKALSLGLAGARSFSDTFNDVSAKGGTPTQAAVLGVFNAGTEIATEYIPLEEWWKVAENGSDSVKAMLKAAAKQGAMEMTQEEIGFLATTMAEYAVLREKSEFQVLKKDLIASGMTEEQAERAIWEEFGRQAAGVAVTSFFSGALSEAGAEAYRTLMPGTIAPQQTDVPSQSAKPTALPGGEPTPSQSPSVTALPGGEPRSSSTASEGGKDGDVSEVGTVPKAETPLTRAQDYYRQNGTISNSMAEAILADNEALTELTKLTPVKLDGTKSQNRAEIRAAVARISGEAELSAEGQVQTMADALGDVEERQRSQAVPDREREADLNGAVEAAMRGELYQTRPAETIDNETLSGYDRINTNGGAAYAKQETDAGADWNRNRSTGQSGAGRRSAGTSEKPGEGRSLLRGEGLPEGNGREPVRGETAGPGGYTDDYDRFDGSVTRDSEGKPLREGTADALRGTTAVDGNGAPIAVYHGTPDMDFTEFRNGEAGHHFGTLRQAEKRINTKRNERGLDKGGGRVFRAFLNIQNPVYVDVDIGRWDANSTAMLLRSVDMITDRDLQEIAALATDNDKMDSPATKKLHQVMERIGIDGIAYPNMIEGEGLSYMVPNPDQIIVDEVRVYDQNMNQTGTREGRKPAMGAADRGFSETLFGPPQFAPETAKSKVYSNTYANATDEGVKASGKAALKEDRNIANYEVVTEKRTLRGAQQRTATDEDIDAEYEILMREPMWSGEDNDTAMIVLKKLMQRGDTTRHRLLSLRQREMGTWGGQLIQSFAKYSRTDVETVTDETLKTLYNMGRPEVDKRFWKNADGENDGAKFNEWRDTVAKTIMRIGTQLEGIADGDYESMRQIVKELAQFRRTTAGFGSKNELTKMADKGINKLDFESLKTVAKAQLGQIPNDFRKVKAGEVIKSISIMNMLSSLVTVNRNVVGNASTGLMDAFSDSSAGRLVDVLLGKITGVRTVGNDIKHRREYFRGARDAAWMAAVCAELAIPMDDAEYTGATRTFSPQGNMLTRFLSGYEMGMKYALEVTDKFFEGGARASVKASLDELGKKSGLVDDEVDMLAGKVGLRRTYKEGRAFAKASKGVKAGLNYLGKDGTGVGDVFMPFAGVPAEVAQVGVDYTAGVAEGLVQMIGIIKDAKAGETIDPARQRAAVTNFGRGVSGTAMIAIFTALAAKGAIKVFDDEDRDKESLEQSLGYSGAVWNLSASLRAITGQDTTWRGTDIKVSLEFLQPFNAQMYIAAELAEEDGFWNMVKAYPKAAVSGIAKSIMDIPMFGTFEDIQNVVESFGEVGENPNAVTDAIGQMVGNVGTRAIPSWLRQTAQYIDPNYRDTSADNALGKAWNQIVAAIPGASKTLPMKYDGFGNPQLRYDDKVLGFFNTFISPGKFMGATAPESAYDMAAYLEQLADITGDKTMYPDSAAPKSFSMDGEKVELSKEQQSEYQRVYGENISDLYGQLMADEAFRKLPAEKQIEVLKSAKTLADDYAKAHTVGEGETSPGNLREAVGGLVNSRISKDIGGAFDDLRETGYTGAAAQDAIGQMEAALDIYDGLSKDQKEAFLEGNSGRVASLIRATEKGMSVATFAELYGHYKEIEGNSLMSKKDQANAWGAYLYNQQKRGKITPAQVAQLREDIKIWQQFPVDPAKLDTMVEAGLGTDAAMDTIDLIAGLEPKEGNVEVTPAQKWAAIVGSDMTDAEMDITMKAYMTDYNPDAKNPDRTELKYDAIRDMGFSPEQFVAMYEAYSNTKGKWMKIGALDAMPGVSNREAQLLYSIYSGDYFKKK